MIVFLFTRVHIRWQNERADDKSEVVIGERGFYKKVFQIL